MFIRPAVLTLSLILLSRPCKVASLAQSISPASSILSAKGSRGLRPNRSFAISEILRRGSAFGGVTGKGGRAAGGNPKLSGGRGLGTTLAPEEPTVAPVAAPVAEPEAAPVALPLGLPTVLPAAAPAPGLVTLGVIDELTGLVGAPPVALTAGLAVLRSDSTIGAAGGALLTGCDGTEAAAGGAGLVA